MAEVDSFNMDKPDPYQLAEAWLEILRGKGNGDDPPKAQIPIVAPAARGPPLSTILRLEIKTGRQ